MARLQACCSDIPLLTSATQDMHVQITNLLLESQGHAPLATQPQTASYDAMV